jgi:hypothetical protein
MIQRGGEVVIRMLENVQQRTIKPLIQATIGCVPPSTHGVSNWAARLAMPTVMRASHNAKPAPPSEAAWNTPALSRGADVWLADV